MKNIKIFDGLDGSGKTTLCNTYLRLFLDYQIFKVEKHLFQNWKKQSQYIDDLIFGNKSCLKTIENATNLIIDRGLFSVFFYQLLFFGKIIYDLKNQILLSTHHHILLPSITTIKKRLGERKQRSLIDDLLLTQNTNHLKSLIQKTLQILDEKRVKYTLDLGE